MDSLVYGVKNAEILPEEKGELRITVDALPFMRDNEYKSKLAKGYTLPGVWLDPTISYQPLKNLRIEAGAHFIHFWGADKYPNFNYSRLASWQGNGAQNGFHSVPVFRAHFMPKQDIHIILGTLYGKTAHGLCQPLYNEELNLSADPETGAQILWNTSWMKLDAWINWDSFIYRNDEKQESFSFGLSTRFRPSHHNARTQWYLPIQAVFQHRGGEINTTAEDREIKTWLNAAAGAGVNIPLHTAHVPVTLNFEAMGTYFSQQAGTLLPFGSGYGALVKAETRIQQCKVSVGWWHCKNFVSIFGNPLYGAMSIDNEGFILHKPHALTAHTEYANALGKGFSWGVHADVFHQFGADAYAPAEGWHREKSSFNFSAGIYVRVCPSFLLKKW